MMSVLRPWSSSKMRASAVAIRVLPRPTTSPMQDAAALVEVVGGDLDGGVLELEQRVAEVARDAELGQAGARLLGQVVGHLHVDVVGRERSLRAPSSCR